MNQRATSAARAFALGLSFATSALAQNGWEMATEDGSIRTRLEARVIAEFWHADEPPPGLLQFDGEDFFGPRLDLMGTLMLGDYVYLHALARYDRGFDPGAREDGEFRLDEAFVRIRPLGDERLNLQAGKFATFFGAWPARHDFRDNPLISPPLPYSRVLGLPNHVSTPSVYAVTARRALPDVKATWVSPVWDASYSTGAAIFGTLDRFDYALEVKNAALSAQPDFWDPGEQDFDHPTLTGRLGWRPDAMWAFGVSASRGAWMIDAASPTLPKGTDAGDFDQSTIGADARWAWHDFIVSGEVIASRFETPAGDLDTVGWFIEGRWKLDPQWWVAGRFGQQFFDSIATRQGRVDWDRDTWQAGAGIGWKINEHALLKLEYMHTHEAGDAVQGENTLALAAGWTF